MKIAYVVHDQRDPAVARRVAMLRRGGAEVKLLGFRRGGEPEEPAGDFGRTFDARMAHRAGMVARTRLRLRRFEPGVKDADVLLARSLEALVLAVALARRIGGRRTIYECLDVHRMMIAHGPVSAVLRAVERHALSRADGLIVSSPAFLREYFDRYQPLKIPRRLVENKVLSAPPALPPSLSAGPPWRIGWFGALRCRRSLEMLVAALKANAGLFTVVLRGRPAVDQVGDLHALAATTPGLSFEGPYTAEDLPRIYGEVHLAWAIDYMEEGLNSRWLLPNRLYEAPAHGVPVLALEGTETARRGDELGCAATLADPSRDLAPWLQALTRQAWTHMRAAVQAVPVSALVADDAQCGALVDFLAGRAV